MPFLSSDWMGQYEVMSESKLWTTSMQRAHRYASLAQLYMPTENIILAKEFGCFCFWKQDRSKVCYV